MFGTQPEQQHAEIDADDVVAVTAPANVARNVLVRSGDAHVRLAIFVAFAGRRKVEVSNPTPSRGAIRLQNGAGAWPVGFPKSGRRWSRSTAPIGAAAVSNRAQSPVWFAFQRTSHDRNGAHSCGALSASMSGFDIGSSLGFLGLLIGHIPTSSQV